MLIDFHCHDPYPAGIVCTDSPTPVPGGLMTCIGLLPAKWTEESQNTLLTTLESDRALHLGEVGLDRRFKDRVPMDLQVKTLTAQLSKAIELGRSVSLHCVQATGPMLDVLSALSYRPYSILWHGFTGSKETAARLENLKVIISIGPRTKGPLGPLVEANGHFVLETDYEGSSTEEHTLLLEDLYSRAAIDTGSTIKDLEAHCSMMFKLFSSRHSD